MKYTKIRLSSETCFPVKRFCTYQGKCGSGTPVFLHILRRDHYAKKLQVNARGTKYTFLNQNLIQKMTFQFLSQNQRYLTLNRLKASHDQPRHF